MSDEKNYELDNRTGINHEGKDANRPVERLTATSIIGDSIENNKGQSFGKIGDLMINLNTGKIEYAVVESGGLLGVGKKMFAIPFRHLHINEDKELFVIDRDKDYIKDSPGFDPSHWPGTNDHAYLDNVDTYYNPPPISFP